MKTLATLVLVTLLAVSSALAGEVVTRDRDGRTIDTRSRNGNHETVRDRDGRTIETREYGRDSEVARDRNGNEIWRRSR